MEAVETQKIDQAPPPETQTQNNEEVVKVDTPLLQAPYSSLVDEFAQKIGIPENRREAALILHKKLRELGLDPLEDVKQLLTAYERVMQMANSLSKMGPEAKTVGEAIASRATVDLSDKILDEVMNNIADIDMRQLYKILDKKLLIELVREAFGKSQNGAESKLEKIFETLLQEIRELRNEIKEVRNFTPPTQQAEGEVEKLEKLLSTVVSISEKLKPKETDQEVKELLKQIAEKLENNSKNGQSFTLYDFLTNEELRNALAPLFVGDKLSVDDWIKIQKMVDKRNLLKVAIDQYKEKKKKEVASKTRRTQIIEDSIEDTIESIAQGIENAGNIQPTFNNPQPPTTTHQFTEEIHKCQECGSDIRVIAGVEQRVTCKKCGAEYEYVPNK